MIISVIELKNVELSPIIGAYSKEREQRQKIIANISIKYDAKDAIEIDDVSKALDYAILTENIKKEVFNTEFVLLEKLADFILDLIFKNDIVLDAQVSLTKVGVLPDVEAVSVVIGRVRP